jgi:hypothetical protein
MAAGRPIPSPPLSRLSMRSTAKFAITNSPDREVSERQHGYCRRKRRRCTAAPGDTTLRESTLAGAVSDAMRTTCSAGSRGLNGPVHLRDRPVRDSPRHSPRSAELMPIAGCASVRAVTFIVSAPQGRGRRSAVSEHVRGYLTSPRALRPAVPCAPSDAASISAGGGPSARSPANATADGGHTYRGNGLHVTMCRHGKGDGPKTTTGGTLSGQSGEACQV